MPGLQGRTLKRVLFDVEGNGLLDTVSKIHCICTVDVDTLEERDFGPDQIQEGIEYLKAADTAVAHFGIGYDFPAIYKVLGLRVPEEKQRDTVVLARLKFPNVKETDGKWNKARLAKGEPTMGEQFGRHTIEAWGIRLGVAKLHTDIEDWSEWTPQIQERCHGDVQTNLKLWQLINPDKIAPAAIELEHLIQRLTNRITAAGWPFDLKAAGALYAELVGERDKAEKLLVAQFGGWWAPKAGNRVKGDAATRGQFIPKKTDKKRGYVAGQACTKIEWVTFNPSSHKHIERCLSKLGWKPTEFTEKGSPKLDEEQLDNIAVYYPQAASLTRYLMLNKRISQLATGDQALMKAVTADGRIHGNYNPLGTVTSRMAHFNPNLGQVPANSIEYGSQFRALFTVPPGYVMLGADMASLEGRCLAHYLAKYDNGDYGRALLEGDPHWAVVKAMGFLPAGTERDKHNHLHTIVRETGAKRGFYAMLYGAGGEKVGRIILDACRLAAKTNPEWAYLFNAFFGDWGEAPSVRKLQMVGNAAKRAVIEGIPGFSELMETLAGIMFDQNKRGKPLAIPGLDKRIIPIRSEHAALNSLLQSCGAILCKRWNVDAVGTLEAEGLVWDRDFWVLGLIHDEMQLAVRKEFADKVGAIIVKAAQEAGKPYGFRIRLDSSYKIGANWAETH